MAILAKLQKPVPDRDRVVILEENGIADIATVYDSDDQAYYASSPAQDYAIPAGDIKNVYVGPSGRIFLLGADPDYVKDTERLAALERSIVLRQITHYTKPAEEQRGLNIGKIMQWVLIAVLLLAVIFK